MQIAIEPHLFSQPTVNRKFAFLSAPGMTTTGIAPQASGVIFVEGPALQHQAALAIKDKDRKGAVQKSSPVHLKFVPESDCMITLIHQDQLVFHDGAGVRLN